MLVKIKSISEDEHKVKVIMLDIDDYGSLIPLESFEFNLPSNDNAITDILKNSSYAAIFTEGDSYHNDATIILANGITYDELDKEKKKIINTAIHKR
jgi:hypothetical protein